MRLLIVTDHTFQRTRDGVLNEFCFDRGFYEDCAVLRSFAHHAAVADTRRAARVGGRSNP